MSAVHDRHPSSVSTPLFWACLAFTTLWKLVAAYRLEITFDEGYYFYWSLFPQLSYFDHPPLSAWAIWLAGQLFQDSVWTVRFWPILSGIIFACIGRMLCRELFSRAAADIAGCALLLAPVFLANGLLMTPDTIFAPAWAAAVYCTWRALKRDDLSQWGLSQWGLSPWWAGAGLCAGLGALSKYNMLLFYISLGVLMLVCSEWRKRIFCGAALAGVFSLAVFSPVIIWNAERDWISFRFQLAHGLTKTPPSAWASFFEYVGALFLIVTPFVSWAVFQSALRRANILDLRRLFLSTFFWTPVLFFGWTATRARVEANWPMIAFFTGTILLASDWGVLKRAWRQTVVASLVVVDLVLCSYLLLPNDTALVVAGKQLDPKRVSEFFGSDELASAVEGSLKESGNTFVLVQSHQLFGTLAFYAPDLRAKLLLSGKGRRRFPWIDDEKWRGKNALLVGYNEVRPDALSVFRSVEFIGTIEVPIKKHRNRKVYLYNGRDYQPAEE